MSEYRNKPFVSTQEVRATLNVMYNGYADMQILDQPYDSQS